MTTAHRPTWYNAIGGENQGGNRKVSQTAKVCSKDLPGHLKMKTRDLSDYVDDKNIIKENLMKLENNKNNKIRAIENIKTATNQEYSNMFPEDEDDEVGEDFLTNRKKKKKGGKKKKGEGGTKQRGRKSKYQYKGSDLSELENENEDDEIEEQEEDQDEDSENDSTSDSGSDSYSDSEQDEEEKELLRELENLRREKIEKEKKEKEEQEKLKKKTNNVLTNNPLINLADSDEENSDLKLKKRKWTDDAIFRNTCEREPPKKKLTFVNDSVRSAFHKKFLFKYIH